MSKQRTAGVFDTHRMATDDGPGMRTTLFFQGCPMRCRWCHNPESISMASKVWSVNTKACIDCGECSRVCPRKAMVSTGDGRTIDRQSCDNCGECAEVCPTHHLQSVAENWTVDQAAKFVLKDKPFYDRSGGGVTASGGEPLSHAEFVAELFRKLQAQGVHTALDTCGLCSAEQIQSILPHTDLILWDIKTMNPEEHAAFTGVSNERILENLLLVAEWVRNHSETDLWIRTPLAPGMTATSDTLRQIGTFLQDHLAGTVSRWDLCAFNPMARDKYKRLGLTWELAETPLLTKDQAAELLRVAQQHAPAATDVSLGGPTQATPLTNKA